MQSDDQHQNNEAKQDQGLSGDKLAMGIAIGLALGAGIGTAIDNIAVGIGVGIAIGVAIGVAWSESDTEKCESGENSSSTDES